MNSPYLIGLGAGLASAVLFLSSATGSLLAMMLFFLAALPGFLAGLGWGWFAALISAASASLLIAALIGPAAGLVYFSTLGLPVALLCYLALLARPAEAQAGAADGTPQAANPQAIEWYPVGRIVSWATLMAGGIAALSIPLLGFDAETYRQTARAYFDTAIVSQLPAPEGKPVNKEKLEPLIDIMIAILPATSAMVWLTIMTTNMWAAGRIAQASGRAIRPMPDLSTMTYPTHMPLAFIASILLTFLPGIAGIVATGFAGAFLLAYIFMGLTVMHTLVRASPLRPFLLAILYLSMIFIGWIALLIAMIGLGEPVFKLRQRALHRNQPPGQPGA